MRDHADNRDKLVGLEIDLRKVTPLKWERTHISTGIEAIHHWDGHANVTIGHVNKIVDAQFIIDILNEAPLLLQLWREVREFSEEIDRHGNSTMSVLRKLIRELDNRET